MIKSTTKSMSSKHASKPPNSNSILVKNTIRASAFLALSSFFISCTSESVGENTLKSDLINERNALAIECDLSLPQTSEFNVFVRNGVTLIGGDSDGPIAMGGDLTLNGLFTAAGQTGGSFYDNNEDQPASLVVNGKINYVSNEGIHLNKGYVKIGDVSGSNTHGRDQNNAISNTRITQGSYTDQPRIHVQRHQDSSSVNVSDLIDFEEAFEQLNAASNRLSQLPSNVELENGNKITLADNTINVLNLTGDELNNLINFTFNNKPTERSPLVINIDHEGDFLWNVRNQAGIGDQEGAHIVFNFYNSTVVTLDNGGATVTGSVLAPNADVIKKTSGNINGQLVAASYEHVRGELHQHVFTYCDGDDPDIDDDFPDGDEGIPNGGPTR